MRVHTGVMVDLGFFEERVVYTSRKRPQIGYADYQGVRQKVYIGFWMDDPVWVLVQDAYDEQEYEYCAQKSMSIEDDPDYYGEGDVYE